MKKIQTSVLPVMACLILGVSTAVASVSITAESSSYTAELSNGSALPEGFNFALGSFGAFSPTTANLSSWQTNWTALATGTWTSFDDFNFSGILSDSNPAPFTVGGAAFVWGYDSQLATTGSEWILFSNPNWNWPVSPVGPGVPVTWSLANSGPTTVIVGTVDNGNSSFQTTAIPEPGTTCLLALAAGSGIFLRLRRRG